MNLRRLAVCAVLTLSLLLPGCAHLQPASDTPRDTSHNYLSESAREIGAPPGSPENPRTESEGLAALVSFIFNSFK